MKLSIAMMVKDEEKNIRETLQAVSKLKKYIDIEIIIVDTGSTDDTVKIANEYTDNIYFEQWDNNFAKIRNITIGYCKGEWILVLDGDEVLENPYEVVKLLTSYDAKKYNTVTIKVKNYSNSLKEKYSIGNIYRLFKRNSGIKYEGIIHERPICKLPVYNSEIIVNHVGYIVDDYKLMQYKFERNTELLHRLLGNGDDIYTYFQLSQSYYLARKEVEGLFYIRKAIQEIEVQGLASKYIFVYTTYCRELFGVKSFLECIDICKNIIPMDKNILDTYYLLANCYYNEKQYEDAYKYANEYLIIRKKRLKGICKIDANIEEMSWDRAKDIEEIIFVCEYFEKNYSECVKTAKEIIKNSDNKKIIEKIYYECLIKTNDLKTLRYELDKSNDEYKYEFLVDIINSISLEKGRLYKWKIYKELLGIDSNFDVFIQGLSLDKPSGMSNYVLDMDKFNFECFYKWKGEVFKEHIKLGGSLEKILGLLNKEDVVKYIEYINKDYECIDLMLKYSKTNIFTEDLQKLFILNCVESALINSGVVGSKEFKKLVIRRIINNNNFLRKIYSDDVFEKSYGISMFSEEERFWSELFDIISIKEKNQYDAIVKLKSHVKKYNILRDVYEVINQIVVTKNLNDDMYLEMENIINHSSNMIENGKVEQALLLLKELYKITGVTSEVCNALAVIYYYNCNHELAIENLANAFILNSENKDISNNIEFFRNNINI